MLENARGSGTRGVGVRVASAVRRFIGSGSEKVVDSDRVPLSPYALNPEQLMAGSGSSADSCLAVSVRLLICCMIAGPRPPAAAGVQRKSRQLKGEWHMIEG